MFAASSLIQPKISSFSAYFSSYSESTGRGAVVVVVVVTTKGAVVVAAVVPVYIAIVFFVSEKFPFPLPVHCHFVFINFAAAGAFLISRSR